ncbi:MAG: tRNA pseudouridine(55) synthase TruB [Gemmatimonadetes bacterium]|uniref:tRNA pseudouridine synthase B n=1 Tax=Candidatus Kutchimonas denitrificans TaxID=3056748 RepID=A0AAE4ZCT5_9BACT|nr:tRNA pseudouridine(55) synthase TruB [Gemmatimonadota bacterium]NIR76211.1 tRNA pseudouridine(55) synthase TruB [Candidatus Kutchimonas denitrificans]NIS00651.1 tRNA pseudouridine(55) synthase TruB [Gemmatimonadota bacterium]NIT66796.1 tRNA pseudouridine(55) synthase TruB [Gemmatimonadota bacterium]NIV23395.1 tRNA pseudouridine(55) synthase TruB [Gemmatimonadota bacterium]
MKRAGLLLVDKPSGPTSHDTIASLRRLLRTRRVGHTGTLDPFATGLLVVPFGWATRLAEYLGGLPKSYHAVACLGVRTDTDDRTGRVLASSEAWHEIDADDVRRALGRQLGAIEQRPPDYSAKKVSGKPAYRLARSGEPAELTPQRVTIHRLELLEFEPPRVSFEIECSSGTYVRAVARDLGETLGVGAHLEELRRTRIGPFRVEEAIRLDEETTEAEIEARALPAAAAVGHLPRVDLDDREADSLRHGREIECDTLPRDGTVAVFVGDELAAVAEARDGRLRPRKVFIAA